MVVLRADNIHTRHGFTVVELIIAIVVIAILASITAISYRGIQERAYAARMQSDLQQAAAAIELQAQKDSGRFPGQSIVASLPKSDDESSYEYGTDGVGYCLALSTSRENVDTYHMSSNGNKIEKGVCTEYITTDPLCFSFSGGTISSYTPSETCPSDGISIPSQINGVNVTAIAPVAFYNKGITNVGTLKLPSTVLTIGDSAFRGIGITSLTLPSSVTTIGYRAFYSNSITSLTIPSSVTSISTEAFRYNQLDSVVFPSTFGSISIGEHAFQGANTCYMPYPYASLPGYGCATYVNN